MEKQEVRFKLKEVLTITIVSTLVMSLITGFVVYKQFNSGRVNTTNNKYVNEFIKAYNDVVDNYYEDVDEDKVIDAAINGMLSYLGDDYTTYLNETNTDNLNEKLAGTYEGIGITIKNNDEQNIIIVSVLNDSPAKKAGILEGDIISKLNEESVIGLDATLLTDKIADAKTVKLEILRNGEYLNFEIEKKELMIPALTSEIKVSPQGHKIGYLYLSSFTSSLALQVNEEITKFEKANIDNLIIDVRGNSGGYLKAATDILELFLEKNKVMFTLKYKKKEVDYKAETDNSKNFKTVVLINGSSASASEVLASALKDNKKAILIGNKSYGKGKVQMTGELKDGSMYKYTSATWLRPNGECIDGKGIKPDIEVNLDENYLNNPLPENDNQLKEAINYFDN